MKDNFINNKMKILSIFVSIIFVFFILKPSPESKIKKTIGQFWNCLENNKFNESVDLFYEGNQYSGGLHMDYYFLKKNYKFVESQITPLDKIKIKDTIIFGSKMKYVNYTFKSKNPQIKQLIINFILILIISLFLYFANENRSKYYTSFWVESLPILWWILIVAT